MSNTTQERHQVHIVSTGRGNNFVIIENGRGMFCFKHKYSNRKDCLASAKKLRVFIDSGKHARREHWARVNDVAVAHKNIVFTL